MKFVLCTILTFVFAAGGGSWADEVKSLPGLTNPINFKHYSGYLNASPKHKLHYWFVESQGNPATDPFLVWLNGGPGCSSLDGFLSELGPFHIKTGGHELYINNQSWNRIANVLFLEGPIGVGFSYSTDGDTQSDDDSTSLDNYEALKDFFTRVKPQYRNHELYITGESYGGVYVPTFVERIIDGLPGFPLNIKGMAIGNGMLSDRLNTNTLMEFAYYHGLVDDKIWNLVQSACCNGCTDTCDFSKITSKFCIDVITNVTVEVWGNQGLNVYDLYRNCVSPPNAEDYSGRYKADVRHFKYVNNITTAHWNDYKKPSRPVIRKGYDADLPCVDDSNILTYLNLPEVRRALFIPEHLPDWTVCSEPVTLSYRKIHTDLTPQIMKAFNHNLRILIYNGDTDMACNFLMGQQFCRELNIPRKVAKAMWHYNNQIAGFVTKYGNLDFVTIKGAGHLVPQWKPGQAFKMIDAFLNQKDLS